LDPGQNGDPGDQSQDPVHPTMLKITLFNDSCGTYISPGFGVCPKGMADQDSHHFVNPPAVIAPGDAVTYTSDQVAGAADGDCVAFSTDFTVGIPSWGYGPTPTPDNNWLYVGMTYGDPPYVGFIGTQFHCGDTIELHWSNCDTGGGAGVWTSEVIPGPGNPQPTAPFGPPPA
jgi:hypothetical protein